MESRMPGHMTEESVEREMEATHQRQSWILPCCAGCSAVIGCAQGVKDNNPRFMRVGLVSASILLAFFGWMYFFFNYLYSSGSTFVTWLPGIVGTVGFVFLNSIRFPSSDASWMGDSQQLTKSELLFVVAISLAGIPVLISFFFVSVDLKEGYTDGIGSSMMVQTISLLLGGLGASYGASMASSGTEMY